MLFNIITRSEEALSTNKIPLTQKGRLVYAKDNYLTMKNDKFVVGFEGLFGYEVNKQGAFQPILDKVCLVVYKDSSKETLLSTALVDREIKNVDGADFIEKFIDNDGVDITDKVYDFVVNNYVEVLDQITPLVTHNCTRCGRVYVGDRCEPCYQKHLKELRLYRSRQSYSWKPDPIFNKGDKRDKDLHMGFELEMEDYEGNGLDPDDAVLSIHETLNRGGSDLTVYCKSDGSLEDGGVEMVSHPRTLDYFMSRFKEFESCYDDLASDGWRSEKGGHCGMHVHIDKKFLGKNVDYVCAKIGYIFSLFWDELLCVSRRSSNGLGYCHKNDIDITDSKETCIGKIKDQKWGDRYVAVNNKPEHTLEIRLWRGTLNARIVMATLDLTRAIVLCAKKYSINTLQRISFGDIINKMKYEENKKAIVDRLTAKGVTSRLTPTRKTKKDGK